MLYCTQYTLSEETISYLKHPTFDIWHWETNEVGISSSSDKVYTRAQNGTVAEILRILKILSLSDSAEI